MRPATVAGLVALVGPTGAVTLAGGETTSTTRVGADGPSIIPEPNQGVAPTDAGDRGGALQVLTFALILVAIVVMVLLVRRDARRSKPGRRPGPGDGTG